MNAFDTFQYKNENNDDCEKNLLVEILEINMHAVIYFVTDIVFHQGVCYDLDNNNNHILYKDQHLQ